MIITTHISHGTYAEEKRKRGKRRRRTEEPFVLFSWRKFSARNEYAEKKRRKEGRKRLSAKRRISQSRGKRKKLFYLVFFPGKDILRSLLVGRD